jgi:hypothetical protein
MMRLETLWNIAKQWWNSNNGTVSIWELTMAKAQDKLSTGLIYMLSLVDKAMSKIRLGAFATQSRAKETIARRTTEQIKSVAFSYNPNIRFGVGALKWNSSGQYNTAIGYQAGYTIGTGLSVNNSISNNNITFSNKDREPVLIITKDGDVEWHGKPSEAADALVRTFQFKVEDMKGVTKAARRRYYLRACQNILNKAETMEHAEFIDFLKKHVYNKERTVIMDSLKYEQD